MSANKNIRLFAYKIRDNIFIIMFWIFRVVVCYTSSMAIDIGFEPIDLNKAIIIL